MTLDTAPRALDFRDLARTGRTGWWTWPVALLLMTVALFVGSTATVLLLGKPAPGSLGAYLTQNLPFVWVIIGIVVAVRLVHRRSLRSLITDRPRVRVGAIFGAAALWLVGMGVGVTVEQLVSGAAVRIDFDAGRFLALLPFVLLLTPLQTSAEELFFRGYLLQATALLTRRTGLLVIVNGLVFMLPHTLNSEARDGGWLLLVYYFAFGAFLALLTLRTGAIELALGVHAMNNLAGAILLRAENYTLTTETLLVTGKVDPVGNLVGALVSMAVFAVLAWRAGLLAGGRPPA